MTSLETHRFGIELETVGLTRLDCARQMAMFLGGTVEEQHYKCFVVKCGQRTYSACYEPHLRESPSAEIVSPILTLADLSQYVDLVRSLRDNGVRTSERCGLHVHVDGAPFSIPAIQRLVAAVRNQPRDIYQRFAVSDLRMGIACKPLTDDLYERLLAPNVATLEELKTAWYGTPELAKQRERKHYHPSRRMGVNLSALWWHGTIEFRWFNATLDPGQIEESVRFCLKLAVEAVNDYPHEGGSLQVEHKVNG